jgi:hypothetical protein
MATVERRTTRRLPERAIDLQADNSPLEKTRQFLALKFQEGQITSRKNKLRDEISAFVDANGETDEKGSRFWDLPTPIEINGQKFVSVKRERRSSPSIDEDKIRELLLAKATVDAGGVTLYSRVFKPVTEIVLDQAELYVLNQEGLITDEELDSFFVETVSFAFKPLQG